MYNSLSTSFIDYNLKCLINFSSKVYMPRLIKNGTDLRTFCGNKWLIKTLCATFMDSLKTKHEKKRTIKPFCDSIYYNRRKLKRGSARFVLNNPQVSLEAYYFIRTYTFLLYKNDTFGEIMNMFIVMSWNYFRFRESKKFFRCNNTKKSNFSWFLINLSNAHLFNKRWKYIGR